MKKNIFILLIFLISNRVNAQFSLSFFPETIRTINKICFYNNKIFIVNANPNFLLTVDGGRNFTKISTPNNYNNAIAINDSVFIFVYSNKIKVTNDRGLNWIEKHLINENGDTIRNNDMYDFHIFKNGKGFTTNYLPQKIPKIYLTKNRGETWNLIDSTKNNFTAKDYKANSFSRKQYNFDSASYVMKQSSDSILVKYSNYGENVSEINLAEKGIIQMVYQIAFKDENNGMILTSYSSTETQKLYLTNDGCKTFNEIIKPAENFSKIEFARATSNKTAFYIASFISSETLGTGGSYYTKDNGKTWNKNKDENYLRSIDFYDAETGIVTIGRDANFNTNIFYFTGNTTNISETENIENKINIYPNPVNNTLNFRGLSGNISFKIFNIQGQLLLNGTSLTSQINVSMLQNGLFILNLETKKGTFVSKFIKNE